MRMESESMSEGVEEASSCSILAVWMQEELSMPMQLGPGHPIAAIAPSNSLR